MKNFIYIGLVIIIYMVIGGIGSSKLEIPDEAIRIRVIANSNSDYDQKIKLEVKDILENDMYGLISGSKNIEEARILIRDNISVEEDKINNLFMDNNYNMNFDINFGYNYFPAKEFKGVRYNEGYYESLVVTIGEGSGDNWWCVLFPPFCLVEANGDDMTDIEYSSYLKEMIDKYF